MSGLYCITGDLISQDIKCSYLLVAVLTEERSCCAHQWWKEVLEYPRMLPNTAVPSIQRKVGLPVYAHTVTLSCNLVKRKDSGILMGFNLVWFGFGVKVWYRSQQATNPYFKQCTVKLCARNCFFPVMSQYVLSGQCDGSFTVRKTWGTCCSEQTKPGLPHI